MSTLMELRRGMSRRATAVLIVGAALVGVASGAGVATLDGDVATAASPIEDHIAPPDGTINLTPAELASWQAMTRTPEQRARLVADIQTAFKGVAVVSTSDATSGATTTAARSNGSYTVDPVVAYGVSGDHFWITASYADMVNGAIWVAVRACSAKAPAWVCNAAGSALSSWASGWGSASNHGVWAAIYWWPPRYTGGRW